MKIEAVVDKMMYGTIKVDIPDEQLRDISKREERAIVWDAVYQKEKRGRLFGMRYRQPLGMGLPSNGTTLPALLHTTAIIGQ